MSSYLGAGMGRVRVGGGPTEGPAQQRERLIEGEGAGDLEGLTRGPRLDQRNLGRWKGTQRQGFILKTTGSFTLGVGCSRVVLDQNSLMWGDPSGGGGESAGGLGDWTRLAAVGGE